MLSKEIVGEFQLVLSIIFFGVSFVGQRIAMFQGIGPLTYNAYRFTVSTTLLLLLRPSLQMLIDSEYQFDENTPIDDDSIYDNIDITDEEKLFQLWLWGGICGIANFIGSALQQIALVTVSVGKVGFITGMYVVVVPIIEWFLPKRSKSLNLKSWIAVGICLIGMYFLSGCYHTASCLSGAVGFGEILTIISVFCWAVSILASDMGAKSVDCISLTCIDFIICTILNILIAILFEFNEWRDPWIVLSKAWPSIVIVGFTEASAFTLSTLGQMYTPPSRAALLLSLETVSSAVGGYIVLNEKLSSLEIFGGFLMFLAAVISSIDWNIVNSSVHENISINFSASNNIKSYSTIIDSEQSDSNKPLATYEMTSILI